jgi:hypothetical protein
MHTVLARRILADVAVVEIVIGLGDLAVQEESMLPEAVGVFANVGAEARAGQRPHMLHRVHAKPIDVPLANPIRVRLNQRINHCRADLQPTL